MNRNEPNYWVDATMAVAFALVFVTGAVKFSVIYLFTGAGAGLDWVLISRIHDFGGVALGISVVAHILLHWSWVWTMTRRKLGFGLTASDGAESKDGR